MSFIDDVIIASLLECKSNVDELIAILPVLSSTRVIDKILLKFTMLFYEDSSSGQNSCDSHSFYWRMADYDAIESYLTHINWYSLVSLYPSASVLWNVFMAILLSCVDQFIPRINVSSKYFK